MTEGGCQAKVLWKIAWPSPMVKCTKSWDPHRYTMIVITSLKDLLIQMVCCTSLLACMIDPQFVSWIQTLASQTNACRWAQSTLRKGYKYTGIQGRRSLSSWLGKAEKGLLGMLKLWRKYLRSRLVRLWIKVGVFAGTRLIMSLLSVMDRPICTSGT